MDNRGYDPDEAPKQPVTPGPVDTGESLGPHHETPVPVDPLQGVVHTPHVGGTEPVSSAQAEMPAYGSDDYGKAEASMPATPPEPPSWTDPPAPPTRVAAATSPTPPYGQPQAQPYAPGYPRSEPPPPPRKGGFNWWACCGVGCGVGLIALLLVVFGAIKVGSVFAKFAKSNMGIETASNSVSTTDLATIKSSATPVSPQLLSANPVQYQDKWLAVTGTLIGDAGGAAAALRGSPGLQNATSYWMQPNIVIMDVTAATPVAGKGDMLRAYGKAVQFDVAKIPLFGKVLAEEMKSESNLKGNSTVVLFIAKGVELVQKAPPSAATGSPQSPPEADKPPTSNLTEHPHAAGGR